MISDPISDMLTRMRNALMIKQGFVIIPFSKFKLEILNVVKRAGYIDDIKEFGETPNKYIRVKLKYDENGNSVISGLRKISKSSKRTYVSSNNLPTILSGLGIAVLSTSSGVMTNLEAKKKNIGGEFICEIY